MKLAEIKKLQRLAKAKTDGEKSRYGAVKKQQDDFLAAADAHAEASARPFEPEGEASGADLMLHGRYLEQLTRAEKLCRNAAKALEPEKAARKRALQRTLGEENAWEQIGDRVATARRAKAQDFEENRRSEFILNARSGEKSGTGGD